MRPASVRASVHVMHGREGVPRSAVARDGYQGPTHEKKKNRGRRIDVRTPKRRENIISAGAKARERKKILFGRARKIIPASTRAQPTKGLTYTSFYLFLSGVSTGRRSYNHRFFFESECKRQKIFFESECKKTKNT